MSRWTFVLVLVLVPAAASGCSDGSGSGVTAPIGRALVGRGAATESFQVLHLFENGRDGADPAAGLLLVGGTAYGTTWNGGIRRYAVYNPTGTIFKIDASGHYSVLYRFSAHMPFGRQASPDGGLVNDPAGNFYGTTSQGGQNEKGTVYKLSARGRLTTLYTFAGGAADGEYPYATLLRDARGNLYGTTISGGGTGCEGAGCGTVFEIDTSNHESVLYRFAGGTDGSHPYGGVIRDRHGNLYGTTSEGGTSYCVGSGCGIVFKLDPHGHETILHRFTCFADGGFPMDTPLQGSDGALYSTAGCGGKFYDGIVFKIDMGGNETVLYNFAGGSDGDAPFGGLIQDAAGNFYGTTEFGGGYACNDGNGCGTIFELDTAGNETVLYPFKGKRDGMEPVTGLVMDLAGHLYGTTEYGGDRECNNGLGCGVVFKLKQALPSGR